MQISVSELKTNTGKYLDLAADQEIIITKNGKRIAKLVTAKIDKKNR
jgi:prevent-host-death family protein